MKWIEKKNKKMSALKVCDKFDQMVSRLLAMDQELLKEDKTLYFLKAVGVNYRRELGTLLEDDTQMNGLVTDWSAVKQACNKLDRCCQGLYDIDFIGLSIEKTRPFEVVEQPKQSNMDKKKIDDDSRMTKGTLREDECSRTHIVFETSDDEGESLIEACVKGDKKCEANMIEDLATTKDIKEVAINKTTSVHDEHGKTFFTLVLETWEVACKSQHETQEMEGGRGEVKVEANEINNVKMKVDMDDLIVNGSDKNFPTHALETWAFTSGNQHKTQGMECGDEGKLKANVKDDI